MTVAYDQRTAPPFPDVNRYHPINDLAAFKAAKPTAVGFRVHSDLSGEDPSGKAADAAGAALGIPRLGYDYETDGTAGDFLALFPPAPGRIPVLDAEYKGITMHEAEAWIAAVQPVYNRWPVLYGHALLNTWTPSPGSVLRKCPSWQATYGMELRPVPWAMPPIVWQYSDGATKWPSPGPRSFPGVGPCDMNALLIPVADLRKMAGIVPPPPPGGGGMAGEADKVFEFAMKKGATEGDLGGDFVFDTGYRYGYRGVALSAALAASPDAQAGHARGTAQRTVDKYTGA